MRRMAMTLVMFMCLASIAFGDHLPATLQASGVPEGQLGPVRLEYTSKNDLVKIYGPPLEDKTFPDDHDKSRGERSYIWKVDGQKFGVGTWFRPQGESAIDSAQVWKGQGENALMTGRGLKVGNSLSDVRRIYGKRFKLGRRIDTKRLYIFLQWRNGTELHVDFGPDDRVDHMLLIAPLE